MDTSIPNQAWRLEIISALKVFYYYLTNSDRDLMLGILRPGGGQYYCLSILDARQVLLHMNRDASATTFYPAEFVVGEFGTKAAAKPEKIAAELFAGSKMEYTYGAIDSARASKLRMIAHMLGLLDEFKGSQVDLNWGYFDSSDEGASANFVELQPGWPESWLTSTPVNSLYYGWAANILQITSNGEVIVTYNQQTAEAISLSGNLRRF